MSDKDIKGQVLEDLVAYLENMMFEKAKPSKKEAAKEEEKEDPEEAEAMLLIAEPEECEDEPEIEDDLEARLKKLLAKRGE